MENDVLFEIDKASAEQSSIFVWDPLSVTSDIECMITSDLEIDTKLDQSAVGTEADNQYCIEIAPYLAENDEEKRGSLFAPFSHQMIPDPEYVRLVSEQSTSNQEATTKLINDRYKWIMESAAIRKEKEQKIRDYEMKSTQLSHIIGSEKVVKTTQLSPTAIEDIEKTTQLLHNLHITPAPTAIEDIEKTTQLLHNLDITPDSLTKDQSEEFSDNHHELIYWHNGLNRFIKLDFGEINTKANISSFDMFKTITQHHERRVEDALNLMRNEQKDGEKIMTFTQVSQKVGSTKCRKTTQTFYDGPGAISSSHEDQLVERSESQSEL